MSIIDQPNLPEGNASFMPYVNRFGLIGAMVAIAITLVSLLMSSAGGNPMTGLMIQGALGIASIVILVIIAVRGVKSYREEALGGYITFGKAFVVAALIAAIAALVSGLFSYIYTTYVDPGYFTALMGKMEEMYSNMGMDDSQIEQAMTQLEGSFSPKTQLRNLITGPVISGLLVGLIAGAIGRKNPPEITA